MRSRYSAYVRLELDYLVATHHPQTFGGDRLALQRFAEKAQWLGLEVLSTQAGGPDDERGVVEFRCRFFDGKTRVHHERSSFARDEGRWVYVNGTYSSLEPPGPRSSDKVGRNDPCRCGSGRKYKRCCGAPGGAGGDTTR